MGDSGTFVMSMLYVLVSVANSFVHPSTAADHGYRFYGELACFIYWLLQEIKKCSSLPIVDQLEEYMTPNWSNFASIDEEGFRSRTSIMTALNKVRGHCLRTEFRRDTHRFLEEFVNSLLSTVDSRSVIGQAKCCFCPALVGRSRFFPAFQKALWRTFREWVDKKEQN